MIGEALGNYTITGKLGEGGMGVVYVGEHRLIGRKAAIKVLSPDVSHNKEMVGRFFNEARAATLVKHPGLVEIFDFGQHTDGSAFIVMELLEGESLAACIERQGALSPATVAAIGRQIASALAAAHEKGIVHRDLKPDNVFLVPDSEVPGGQRVKILDFGIAKLGSAGSEPGSVKTRTGAIMGTPAYMSPEQCKSAGEVDARSDIYSLGCVLYEMACGDPPFVKGGFGEILAAHIYEEPRPPRAVAPSVPPELEAVIMRALAKAPEARQATMAHLKDELAALAVGAAENPAPRPDDPAAEPRFPTGPRSAAMASTTLGHSASEVSISMPPQTGSRKTAVFVALGAGLLLIATGGLLMIRAGRAPTAPAITVPVAPPVSEKVVSPPAAPPPPAVVPAKEAAPVAVPPAELPKTVKLKIESDPSSAVVRKAGGGTVGNTPLVLDVARGEGTQSYSLHLDGYHSEDVVLRADRDDAAMVKLRRRGPEKPAAAHAPSGKPQNKVDYDPFQ